MGDLGLSARSIWLQALGVRNWPSSDVPSPCSLSELLNGGGHHWEEASILSSRAVLYALWLFPGSWVEKMWTEAGGMTSLVCLSFLVLWWNQVNALSELKDSLVIFCNDSNSSSDIITNSLLIWGEPGVQKACLKLCSFRVTTCSITEMARGSRVCLWTHLPSSLFPLLLQCCCRGQRPSAVLQMARKAILRNYF